MGRASTHRWMIGLAGEVVAFVSLREPNANHVTPSRATNLRE